MHIHNCENHKLLSGLAVRSVFNVWLRGEIHGFHNLRLLFSFLGVDTNAAVSKVIIMREVQFELVANNSSVLQEVTSGCCLNSTALREMHFYEVASGSSDFVSASWRLTG